MKLIGTAIFAFTIAAAILLAGMLAADAAPRHHHSHGLPWCGVWMESHTGIHGPGNLAMAREWTRVGHAAAGPAPGVIGVLPHHVFQVIQVLASGMVLAISGNDSGAVRTRPRTTAGVIAWRQI
jgi:hypothetical protein